MKILRSSLSALALTLVLAVPALAGGSTGNGQFADVTVKANCSASPKTVTVTNDSSFPITVNAVAISAGSLQNLTPGNPGAVPRSRPMVSNKVVGAGQSSTYTASSVDGQAQNFIVILTAHQGSTAQMPQVAGKTVVAFVGCVDVPKSFAGKFMQGFPGMPATGAGGMASHASLPIGEATMALLMVFAGGYAALKLR